VVQAILINTRCKHNCLHTHYLTSARSTFMLLCSHSLVAFLVTIVFQVGALQMQSTAESDTLSDVWSFSKLVDAMYSDDTFRIRSARRSITSLCEANDFNYNFRANDCNAIAKVRNDDGGYHEFVFALVASIHNNESLDAFTQSYNAVRHFHPHNAVIVVDNASPTTFSAQVVAFVQNDPGTIYLREESSGFEIGGYRRALKSARKRHWEVRGWVFLQATAVLLQPLPLQSLPCKVSSFFNVSVPRPPCGLPEFNRADYEAFRQNTDGKVDYTEMGMHELRRLRYEFPIWDRYEKLVCTENPGGPGQRLPAAMHNMFIATAEGVSGLEDLGFFSMQLEKKTDSNFMEGFNGVFLAALDSVSSSCFLDKERLFLNQGRGSGPGNLVYKQHGSPGGWGQGFFASFLSFISAVDANKDMMVDAWEIADAKVHRPAQFGPALASLCTSIVNEDPFQKAMGCTS